MEWLGMFAALGSAASWAVGAILMKKLGENLSSLAMTLAKATISVVLLCMVLAFVGFELIAFRPLLLLLVSGLLGIAISDTCFFSALKDLEPLSLVLLMMLGQVLTVVLAVLFLHESPSLAVWLGIVLAVVGIGIVVARTLSGDRSKIGLRGVLFGLASVVSMSVSIIIAKKALDTVSTIEATLIRMLAGTIGVFLLGASTGQLGAWMNPFRDRRLAGLFLIAVIIVTFGGFWLSLVAIKYADVCVANTLISTEPVFVLPLSVIFLREKITLWATTGTLIAVAGIILLLWQKAARM
jgi:drug/metabolite transporter (DMT)-like permease